MAAQILGIHHVSLVVADLAAASDFYSRAARLLPWGHDTDEGRNSEGHLLRSVNAGLRLIPCDVPGPLVRRPVNEAGITHICLQTTDIQQLHAEWAAAGAIFHCEPIDLGTGYLYCYARDPEHNVTEIEGVPPVWPDSRPWIAHVSISTPNLSGLADFYANFLATSAIKSPRLRNDARMDCVTDLQQVQMRMAWLQVGNMQLELIQYLEPASTHSSGRREPGTCGYASFTLEVNDLALTAQHLRDCGGMVLDVNQQTGWARCRDPDGNTLELVDPSVSQGQVGSISSLDEPCIIQRFAAAREAYIATLTTEKS